MIKLQRLGISVLYIVNLNLTKPSLLFSDKVNVKSGRVKNALLPNVVMVKLNKRFFTYVQNDESTFILMGEGVVGSFAANNTLSPSIR